MHPHLRGNLSDVGPSRLIDLPVYMIRGELVMLDAVLAPLLGVSMRTLRACVRRHRDRFPSEVLFQLSSRERNILLACTCRCLRELRKSNRRPWAFTEEGAQQLAALLDTGEALDMSLFIFHAFARLKCVSWKAPSTPSNPRFRPRLADDDPSFLSN